MAVKARKSSKSLEEKSVKQQEFRDPNLFVVDYKKFLEMASRLKSLEVTPERVPQVVFVSSWPPERLPWSSEVCPPVFCPEFKRGSFVSPEQYAGRFEEFAKDAARSTAISILLGKIDPRRPTIFVGHGVGSRADGQGSEAEILAAYLHQQYPDAIGEVRVLGQRGIDPRYPTIGFLGDRLAPMEQTIAMVRTGRATARAGYHLYARGTNGPDLAATIGFVAERCAMLGEPRFQQVIERMISEGNPLLSGLPTVSAEGKQINNFDFLHSLLKKTYEVLDPLTFDCLVQSIEVTHAQPSGLAAFPGNVLFEKDRWAMLDGALHERLGEQWPFPVLADGIEPTKEHLLSLASMGAFAHVAVERGGEPRLVLPQVFCSSTLGPIETTGGLASAVVRAVQKMGANVFDLRDVHGEQMVLPSIEQGFPIEYGLPGLADRAREVEREQQARTTEGILHGPFEGIV